MINQRFTLWLNSDGQPLEKPLSEMTSREVLQAVKWHTVENRRLAALCAADIPIAGKISRGEAVDLPEGYDCLAGGQRLRASAHAELKLADLLQLLGAAMPQWQRRHDMKLTAAVKLFWPR